MHEREPLGGRLWSFSGSCCFGGSGVANFLISTHGDPVINGPLGDATGVDKHGRVMLLLSTTVKGRAKLVKKEEQALP